MAGAEKSGEFEIIALRGTVPYPRGGLGLYIRLVDRVTNSQPCINGLQAIQVVFTTVENEWGQFRFKADGKTLQGFIDRGPNSPWRREGREVEDPKKPYYFLHKEMKVAGMETSKGSIASRLVDFYDAPISLIDHDETYFETAVICTNYRDEGRDKVIRSYRWGWRAHGTVFQPRWDAASPDRLEVVPSSTVSKEFLEVLKIEFGEYASQFIGAAD